MSFLKQNLRIKNKKIRESLDIKTLSRLITQRLINLPEFQSANCIFSYISFGSELNTSEILSISNKKIFVPKLIKNEMYMAEYDVNELEINKFGILEPIKNKFYVPNETDVIICPALACDYNFYRLGYGKGFYDKFLSKYNCIKILPIPAVLISENIGHDKFDIQMDIIVTEESVFRRK